MDDWRVYVGMAVIAGIVVWFVNLMNGRWHVAVQAGMHHDEQVTERTRAPYTPQAPMLHTYSPHIQQQMLPGPERAPLAPPVITEAPPLALPGVTTLGQVRAMGWQLSMETVLQGIGPGVQPYTTPAKRAMHLLFAAPTGDGKTNIMLLYALQFIKLGYAVYLLDLKFRPYHDDTEIDWGRVAAATPPGRAYTEPGEILDFLEWAATVELERRRRLFNQGAPLSALGQPMYLFIEEALVLAGLDKQRPVMLWIGKIMQLGRELGIFVAMAVQGALIKALGGSITDQAQTRTRYCGVDVDTTTKMRLLELKSLDSLPAYDPASIGPGVLWLWSDGTARRPTLVRVPLVTAADVEAMLAAAPVSPVNPVIDGQSWPATPTTARYETRATVAETAASVVGAVADAPPVVVDTGAGAVVVDGRPVDADTLDKVRDGIAAGKSAGETAQGITGSKGGDRYGYLCRVYTACIVAMRDELNFYRTLAS